MSCQIKLVANIVDIPAIRRCLFPTDDYRGGDNWLQLCKTSVSPTGDLIALANEKRLVILTGRWNSNNGLSQYQIIFSGCLDELDAIEAILCMPVACQTQSSQVGPDWTCIIIGFESGFVRFYTENCSLLLEEQLHDESIVSIKCQSQHSPRPDINQELKPEEIYVQYLSNICIINGSNLFAILRNCRSQLARVQATGSSVEPSLLSTNPKKWGFSDQASVNDTAVVGLDLANTFNHLLTASTCGGFDTKYRAMAPHNNLVLGSGSKPYVAFHYATEGVSQPVLSDVAKAVANKLKSALPGWLTGNKSQTEKQMSVSMQPADLMGCRFGLCDLRRAGSKIILSQNRKLAAVTDALGRVALIDTLKGITLRIFKGYRDAQCAFIQVPDEKKSKHRTHRPTALFLAIYSPKKGTLEIFSAQQGTKIVTFAASKCSILCYITYGLMGFTTTSKSRYVCQFTCVLIDSDGNIKEIVIPFHFALTEKNSKRARDLHLYKRLKQFVKLRNYDLEKLTIESVNTCAEIKTSEVKLQCLNMIISSKEMHSEVILKCAEQFLEKLTGIEDDDFDSDTKLLKTLSENLNLIVGFYSYVLGVTDEELDLKNGNDKCNDTKLSIGPKEMINLQKLLDLCTLNDNTELKVSFNDTYAYNISKFLHIFVLSNEEQICLKSVIDEVDLYQASETIFEKYVSHNLGFEAFQAEVKRSKIALKDLFKLLLNYWVNRPLKISINLEREMNNLYNIIYVLSRATNIEDITVEYNKISPFWSEIRELLADSSKPFPSLMAAILCKSVAQKIENDTEQPGVNIEEDIEIWEKLSQENCSWTLLIGKLEDISLLNIILAEKPVAKHPSLPLLIHEKSDVSLKLILQKGRGSISELVAQWLTMSGVSPEDIVLNELAASSQHCDSTTSSNSSREVTAKEIEFDRISVVVEMEPIFEHLNILRKQFPHSLEASVLLANMSWEYAVAWQKNIQEMALLEAAVKCLKAVPYSHIKRGLFNLVWNTHLKIIFESTCKLVNKVGKLPKERLCRQDTGLSDYQITLFVNICTDFFDTFMNILNESYNVEKRKLVYELLWENGSQPLVELALQQNEINFDLLHLHHQLSLCIQMMVTFAVKHPKLISNLFEMSVLSLFFTDLQQKSQINWTKADSKVNVSRTQFLIKVIAASIETVTISDGIIFSTDHVHWMSKCLYLARFWNLDLDLFKRYQIVHLFTNGFDQLAEELVSAVTEMTKLGPDLLVVAGKRLSNFLSTSEDLGEKLGAFSPALTTYLGILNGEWCAPCSLESILSLASQCTRCLEEENNDYKLACLMLEACSTLQDLQK